MLFGPEYINFHLIWSQLRSAALTGRQQLPYGIGFQDFHFWDNTFPLPWRAEEPEAAKGEAAQLQLQIAFAIVFPSVCTRWPFRFFPDCSV